MGVLAKEIVSNLKEKGCSLWTDHVSDSDVQGVWDCVSEFVSSRLQNGEAVNIQGLGVFSVVDRKYHDGSQYVWKRRPVFVLNERFAQTHDIRNGKSYLSGNIKTHQLNYALIASDTPYSRDTVERCIKEVLMALNRTVHDGRNVEFLFVGLGRLQFRNGRAKMKFNKMLVNAIDVTVVSDMCHRPGTADSVISDGRLTRPISKNTLVLPHIKCLDKLKPTEMPTIEEKSELEAGDINLKLNEDGAENLAENEKVDEFENEFQKVNAMLDEINRDLLKDGSAEKAAIERPRSANELTSRGPAKANFISFDDCTRPKDNRMNNSPVMAAHSVKSESPIFSDSERSRKFAELSERYRKAVHARPKDIESASANPREPHRHPPGEEARCGSRCCHHVPTSGQELCYLCHQRAGRNIPINFTDELKKRERDVDKFWLDYNKMKDMEYWKSMREKGANQKLESQKVSNFNAGIIEAKEQQKLKHKQPDVRKSYIFENRPATPTRYTKRAAYQQELAEQIRHRQVSKQREAEDDELMAKMEQVQLAEDLAQQRFDHLQHRKNNATDYRNALDHQVRTRPSQLPAYVPDSDGPIFGKFDGTDRFEKRYRSREVAEKQLEDAAQKKREALLRKVREQRHDDEANKRAKQDLKDELVEKQRRQQLNRRLLEDDWLQSAEAKRSRDLEELNHRKLGGDWLLHEICDRYNRCAQCQRKVTNKGTTNVWADTRFLNGSRFFV